MLFFFKCNNRGLRAAGIGRAFCRRRRPDKTYAAALFHTGWFVESLMTQTLIIHVIRTNLIPFFQSRASWQLTMTTILIMAIGAMLPLFAAGRAAGLRAVAVAILADLWRHSALLCRPDASHQMWLVRKNWI